MKCPHCGADLTGDTCEFCGQKVIEKDQGSTANNTAAGGYAGYNPNNPGAWKPSGPPPEKWYEKTWVIILFLIFLWPIGLFLMWRYKKNWGKVAKISITIVVALCVLYSCTSPDKPDTDKTAVPKTTTVKDTAKSEPKKDERKEEIVKEHYEIDLSAGNYTAGKDIPIGIYNITATSGTGNVSSSNMFDGGLNEVMGQEGFGVTQFNNAVFTEGVTLTVSGTSIQLVPVGE